MSKQLEKEYDHDYKSVMVGLEMKYASRRKWLADSIKHLRNEIQNQQGAVEQIRWKIMDSQPHDTEADTTKRMKRSQKREQERRNKNAVGRKNGRR